MIVNLTDDLIITLSWALQRTMAETQKRLHRNLKTHARVTGPALLDSPYARRARTIANLRSSIERYQDALDVLAGLHSSAIAKEGRC